MEVHERPVLVLLEERLLSTAPLKNMPKLAALTHL